MSVDFRKASYDLQNHRKSISFLLSISSGMLIEHCHMCKVATNGFLALYRFLLVSGVNPWPRVHNLFTVVLKVLFICCAPVHVLWCCWLLERGWFSTGDRCSVKRSCCISVAQCELMCMYEPVCARLCVCHHGFKHSVLTHNFFRPRSHWHKQYLPFNVQPSCNVLQWEWVSGENWLKVQLCGENTKFIAHLHRTVRHYMHLDEYIH